MRHYAVNWCNELRFLHIFTYHLTANSLQFAAPTCNSATVATCRYKTGSLTKCPKNSQILQKLLCLLLSISSGQLVLWCEQLVLEDTKKGFS